LLPFASDSFLDGPAQVVHDVSWKVDFVEGGQKVEDQFVICTGLVRPSSFLKKAFVGTKGVSQYQTLEF